MSEKGQNISMTILDSSVHEHETERQYIWRLHEYVEKGEMTWNNLADYVNKNFRESEEYYRSESAYRKPLQSAKKYYDEVFSKFISNQYCEEIKEQRRELEKAKVRFRDERNEYNRQNRIAARTEQKLDYLEEVISSIGQSKFEATKPAVINGDNDLLICLSDVHLGEENSNFFGDYNADVARERLNNYLEQILKIQARHNSESCTLALLGDIVSGNIHVTVQITNRENVIDQIKIVSDLITSFIYKLSQHFKKVNVCSVSGNHSRIAKKEDALKDERLDDLVFFIAQKTLDHIENVDFREYDNFDTTIACTKIRGKEYILVHGDYDAPTESGVMRLCSMIDTFPEAIVMGHRHTPAYSVVNKIKIIQSGCLSGSGNDYCVQKRLVGNPTQVVCVCDQEGVQTFYPVNLF